jgi:hypothetical protein
MHHVSLLIKYSLCNYTIRVQYCRNRWGISLPRLQNEAVSRSGCLTHDEMPTFNQKNKASILWEPVCI